MKCFHFFNSLILAQMVLRVCVSETYQSKRSASRLEDKCFIYFMSLNRYPFRYHCFKPLIFADRIVSIDIIRANLVNAKPPKTTGLHGRVLIDLENNKKRSVVSSTDICFFTYLSELIQLKL